MKVFDGIEKEKARNKALQRVVDKPYRCALFFPAEFCIDIKQAFKQGIIDKNTFLISVEGNDNINEKKRIIKCQKMVIEELGIKRFFIHHGKLETLPLHLILKKDEQVDYAFFDLCGMLDFKINNWMIKCRDAGLFSKNLVFATTTVLVDRNSNMKSNLKSESIDFMEFRHNILNKIKLKMNVMAEKEFHNLLVHLHLDSYKTKKHFVFIRYLNYIVDFMQNKGTFMNIMEYSDPAYIGGKPGYRMLFAMYVCDFDNIVKTISFKRIEKKLIQKNI